MDGAAGRMLPHATHVTYRYRYQKNRRGYLLGRKMASYVTEKVSSIRPSGRSMADKYVEILEQTIDKFKSDQENLVAGLKSFISAGKNQFCQCSIRNSHCNNCDDF